MYASTICWLPTGEGPQLPSKISCTHSSFYKRGKGKKWGHQGLCLQLSHLRNTNPAAHRSMQQPCSLENFQDYVNFQIQPEYL